MKTTLLGILAVIMLFFSPTLLLATFHSERFQKKLDLFSLLSFYLTPSFHYSKIPKISLNEVGTMLRFQAPTLSTKVIDKVVLALKCTQSNHIYPNEILSIIDYSLPSNEKRIWIFNLATQKLLFHTYVSHGLTSGSLLTQYFSNKYNSKASSLGVYTTEKAYRGREGTSLQLAGLDRGFNDNASNRAIVMHGGWYMDEKFIRRYGRAGRSWGCPALPLELTSAIINVIKDNSLLVIYYPDDSWFLKSKFLNCHNPSLPPADSKSQPSLPLPKENIRENILYVDFNNNGHREENEPIVVISSDSYEKIFKTRAPLERMLRRQIDRHEYIALSEMEFKNYFLSSNELNNGRENWKELYFVTPEIRLSHGYYQTQMKILPLGNIAEIRLNPDNLGKTNTYTIQFGGKSFKQLRLTNQFIRWLGL